MYQNNLFFLRSQIRCGSDFSCEGDCATAEFNDVTVVWETLALAWSIDRNCEGTTTGSQTEKKSMEATLGVLWL